MPHECDSDRNAPVQRFFMEIADDDEAISELVSEEPIAIVGIDLITDRVDAAHQRAQSRQG